ncbi:hypothetical protein [Sphingobacterium spiritivorum]|uniref:hypothetical protein n=1 Tax=Sphingobacterium spiritivorum TaxID=258 RepID=UPI00191B19A3|nr:hypothetical protein [Sphingobacterium spiritivorum]QQT24500.1 hypothetical protein I6J02_12110 [Sphingobacterium spiritivorum]
MKTLVKCTYCDAFADTRDHIPSKNILEKPYPNNLLTIPACKKCNQSFSSDEEYFLNVLVEISKNPNLLTRKMEGGSVFKARSRSYKLNARIQNSLVKMDDGKIYFKAETDRIKRVIEKNALGLYVHKYGKKRSLKMFKCTGFYPFETEETRPAEIFMLTYSEKFRLKKWIHIQHNVFSYIVVRDWRRNNRLTMIFHIHNTVWCVIEIPFPISDKAFFRQSSIQYKLF